MKLPIIIPNKLPAYTILNSDNISLVDKLGFTKKVAAKKILILNLMPTKIETETQLLRILGISDFYIDVTFLTTKSYESKNTCSDHLDTFYKTLDHIQDEKFDGMIITGAPVELLEFEDVVYWNELKKIMDYADKNIKSTLYICWGAQAGLYHEYGIKKYRFDKKLFGVFPHKLTTPSSKLTSGFDDEFFAPHSRYTYIKKEDIQSVNDLEIVSESDEAGIYIVQTKDLRKVFVTGHSEYDSFTLYNEYKRDIDKNLDIEIPKNYFLNDNPQNDPIVRWRSHGTLLFSNWLKILNTL